MQTALLFLVLLAQVRDERNLAYVEGAEADPVKHKLDLFLPPEGKPFPTIVWIHGGAWKEGDKRLYDRLGARFAESGIGFAPINYRLSPAVKHPEHVKDCAKAFAWVHGNIGKRGGAADRLFVMGHSAGGHLTALLALDPQYLDELKVPKGAIKGAIPMSGVYWVPPLPGDTKGFLRILPQAFGSDPDVCRLASPVTHVKNAACPFLVLTETTDNLQVRPSMGRLLTAVEQEGVKDFQFVDAEERDHMTIVTRMLGLAADPYRQRVIDFVNARTKALDLAK
jgi:acetyl esterase/lipase